MKHIFDALSQPWLGSFLGLIGIIAAVYFFLKSRRIPRLAFQYREVTLLGTVGAAFPAEVEIRYGGVSVPRVTSTKLILWNSGNTTIDGSDIVKTDPLRFELAKDGSVLKIETLKIARQANGLIVAADPISNKRALVTFDFLDPGDGVSFEVLHSGDPTGTQFLGSVRGLPGGLTDYGIARPLVTSQRKSRLSFPFGTMATRSFLVFTTCVGFALIFTGLFRPQFHTLLSLPSKYGPPDRTAPNWAMVVLGALNVAMPLRLLWRTRRRHPIALQIELPERKLGSR